jgi:hypothetical protein
VQKKRIFRKHFSFAPMVQNTVGEVLLGIMAEVHEGFSNFLALLKRSYLLCISPVRAKEEAILAVSFAKKRRIDLPFYLLLDCLKRSKNWLLSLACLFSPSA